MGNPQGRRNELQNGNRNHNRMKNKMGPMFGTWSRNARLEKGEESVRRKTNTTKRGIELANGD